MDRVRVSSFRKTDTDWVPYVRLADGTEREVFLASQPGSQEAIMNAPETELLVSGGRGPGKTRTVLQTFLMHVGLGYGPHFKGVMLRLTLQGFDEVKSLCESMIRPVFPNARFNINRNEWTWWWNGQPGEILKLGYFQGGEDFHQFQGSSRQFISFDELTQFPDDAPYRNMLSVLRPSGGVGVPLLFRSSTNPNGPGFGWVKRRFKADDLHLQGYRVGPHIPKDDEGLDRRVIYCHLEENQRLLAVQPDYVENLIQSAARPGELEAWTKGSWSITSGGLFDSDLAETSEHSLLPPIPASAVPPTGKLICAYDFGDSAPYAQLYAWISDGTPITYGGRVYPFIKGDTIVFHEIYGCSPHRPNTGVRWTIQQQKQAFIEYEIASGLRFQNPADGRWICRVRSAVADDMIFNQRPGAAGEPQNSMAQDFAESLVIQGHRQRGIAYEPADKSPGTRVMGWQAIRSGLHATVPSTNGTRERPGLFITQDCAHLLRCLQSLPRDLDGNIEDCPDRCEDHLPDALRYLLRRGEEQFTFVGTVQEFNQRRRVTIGR